jgi:hypothetical protein
MRGAIIPRIASNTPGRTGVAELWSNRLYEKEHGLETVNRLGDGSDGASASLHYRYFRRVPLPAEMQAGFTFMTSNGRLTITRYLSTTLEVIILRMTNGLVVTSIGDYTLEGNAGQKEGAKTEVTIPDTVTSIVDWAFAQCHEDTGAVMSQPRSRHNSPGCLAPGQTSRLHASGTAKIPLAVEAERSDK